MEYFQKLLSLLGSRMQARLLWILIFSIFLSVVEVVGISAIMPFIDIAINFESIHSNLYYQWIYVLFGFENDVSFAITFGLVLLGFYLFRGMVNVLHTYVLSHFAEELYAQTTGKLFKTYLAMPYQVFTSKNTSYLTKTIITEASLMSLAIKDVLIMLSEIFIVIFLYTLMLLASWKITLVFTVALIIKLVILTKTISKRIKVVGATRAKSQADFYEIINRVFGNFEHIKLQDTNRLQEINNSFLLKVNKYAKASASFNFLHLTPRLFIETVGFSLIIILLITLLYLKQSNVSYILPTLSLFVLALYRLMPSVNRIVYGYNSLMYYHKSIDIIDEGLKTPQENFADKAIEFKQKIELMGIDFSYQEKLIIDNVNLSIEKGEKVAFVGESGSGKSTLVNLIIGLHQPNQGKIQIDGELLDESNLQSWRTQVGYISQHPYLFDGTIKDNICFGRKVDYSLLDKVLKQANIFDFLQTKQGTDTLVGEGGMQLSGGQKQRVAIARTLYGQPDILVLDEATSALDSETEKKIMDEIYKISQDKTLIVIAHRLSTIEGCDTLCEIKDGLINCRK